MRLELPDQSSLGAWRRALIKELADFPSPAVEADALLGGLFGWNRTALHARLQDPVGAEEARVISSALCRRLNREPVQYITGRCQFWGRNLKVLPGCLVPRPETEFLVQAVLSRFKAGTFLDWGTGTGCIALSLLTEQPKARAVMAEINPRSIKCAWENLKEAGLLSRALLWHSRTPDDIPGGPFDLIVSNPPYVPSGQVDGLMPEVSQWEPRVALDGGPDGLVPYGPLIYFARSRLVPGGLLAVEFGGASQVQSLRQMAEGLSELECGADLSGEKRYFLWQKPEA